MIPLFYLYPRLAQNLPHVSLGEFPTPVHKLTKLGAELGTQHLYIKRDDLSARPYGGNKVRKLEFLLGEAAQREEVNRILSFGYAGSNHTLATAIYTRALGLASIAMLLPQPNAEYVRQNLLVSHAYGAELHHCRNIVTWLLATGYQLCRCKIKEGCFPTIISPGGTSTLGIVGYVNAAFELKQQIAAGDIPEPDFIYVALGSAGTAVGLMLGLKAAQLRTRVVAVAVVPARLAAMGRIKRLFRVANAFLHSRDGSFPLIELSEREIDIRRDYLGAGYGAFTDAGRRAAQLAYTHEGIPLDGTYTAKALAALSDDLRKAETRAKVLLFWNTFNSRDLPVGTNQNDYRQLPRGLHSYFEKDTQTWIEFRRAETGDRKPETGNRKPETGTCQP